MVGMNTVVIIMVRVKMVIDNDGYGHVGNADGEGFTLTQLASKIQTLLADCKLMPMLPALVEIMNRWHEAVELNLLIKG